MTDEQELKSSALPARILLVEDDYLVALELKHGLEDAGFTVTGPATTSEQAVALAERGRFDLVVMDIRLASARDGIDTAIDLWQSCQLRSIFASAHTDARTKARAEAANAIGWVQKPYAVETLVSLIRDALASRD